MKRNSKPRAVRIGIVAVKIYEAHNRSGDADGKRRLRKFSDEAEARTDPGLCSDRVGNAPGRGGWCPWRRTARPG